MIFAKIWSNNKLAKRFCIKKAVLLPLFFFVDLCYADPWFTGPIVASAGRTIASGESNIEFYEFFEPNQTLYGEHGHVMHTLQHSSYLSTAFFSHGIADDMDILLTLPYMIKTMPGAKAYGLGDVTAGIGIQAMRQQEHSLIPNLRIVFAETIPTGKYANLSATESGLDAMGVGSYQSSLQFNFQSLYPIQSQYLRTRLSLSYTYLSTVKINGLNVYGGDFSTRGTVYPGAVIGVDGAAELTLTQHWVAVMEGVYQHKNLTHFQSSQIESLPLSSKIHSFKSYSYSLAPAVEYNFTENIGVIAGVWFTIAGENTAKFQAFTLGLNIYA